MAGNVSGRLYTLGNNTPETARQYLADRSEPAPSGCLLWTKSTVGQMGYGQAWYQGRAIGAHVLAYVAEHGPVPKGSEVRHTCDTPRCVNPEHLILGTRRDNMRDMTARGRHTNQLKTHCKNGHEFTPDNIYKSPKGRVCRRCMLDAQARYRRKLQQH